MNVETKRDKKINESEKERYCYVLLSGSFFFFFWLVVPARPQCFIFSLKVKLIAVLWLALISVYCLSSVVALRNDRKTIGNFFRGVCGKIFVPRALASHIWQVVSALYKQALIDYVHIQLRFQSSANKRPWLALSNLVPSLQQAHSGLGTQWLL